MPSISIISKGSIDDRDSAFPQAVQLPNGNILCSFSLGGGPAVHGGTEFARSVDNCETWNVAGSVLPMTESPHTTNCLKLSLAADANTIYAYGCRFYRTGQQRIYDAPVEAVMCKSTDLGKSWSAPQIIPTLQGYAVETSHAILPLSSGRLLAPAATVPSMDRFGETVFAAISDDQGKSWPEHAVIFHDQARRLGYLEQKLAEVAPGRIMAVCWTNTLGNMIDETNSFALSNDNGATWSSAHSTNIMGQTMTPIPLGGDRLLVLYNRRHGQQGVVMALITFTEQAWTVQHEQILFDPQAKESERTCKKSGAEEWDTFEFGFPTAIKLRDGTFLATYWSKEKGKYGIRWAKLNIGWD